MGAVGDEIIGSAKKVVGAATGNDALRAKGERQEHQGGERVRDKAQSVVDDVHDGWSNGDGFEKLTQDENEKQHLNEVGELPLPKKELRTSATELDNSNMNNPDKGSAVGFTKDG